MKEEKHSYIKGLLHGIGTLLTGKKQKPENQKTKKISPRFR